MDWIREHFALLMLIGIVSLMLIGVLSVHFPIGPSQTKACPINQPNCQPTVETYKLRSTLGSWLADSQNGNFDLIPLMVYNCRQIFRN